uniref:Uncharacterized protein n=1 Tax=Helicotheca tamesis TaxID=374047 RepID=A0A7S2IES7_9STRA|mmetsp:Transcript_8502/g.11702  ORF Transcript_8502/g.11702 Transcript_8502/m.11702 type:complete len:417 (+) Transcript_8502:96-1346(+)|eukprot:CAMPEP_0185725500 /NCGR_PEP_ID=MMETSP1171-20130828/1752_1 /TAXON_ID=374046 /ORGANISM="Helicotheca tamensis, Strain CCMP826" /LENGTH=416 /DNA_ID=CAMNT_0028393645 /DNA_START=92 /DNA_END=1342 /DNA_ORIENTATION=+
MVKLKIKLTRRKVLSMLAIGAFATLVVKDAAFNESDWVNEYMGEESWIGSFSRVLSKDLGGGKCKWEPPNYDVAETETFFKTLITGYPSGDKRLTFTQMEALTALPAKDEWAFQHLGMSNHPFIKTNYPHHEGVWGWDNAADQVIMVVRNIRSAMVEYHDILFDIGYAKTWEEVLQNIPNLYQEQPPMADFLAWRDERVFDEIKWYGWFIDYWMEGGLMRDMFTNKITTPEHWNMLMVPTAHTAEELDYDLVVGADTVVEPTIDPNCEKITNGCTPAKVISAEKLVDHQAGPQVALDIAKLIEGKAGMNVIGAEARGCIWRELVINKKGHKTKVDRTGYGETEYSFTADQLDAMLAELERLIGKYSNDPWDTNEVAGSLVLLLEEHRGEIQTERDNMMYRRMKQRTNVLPRFADKH